MSIARLTGVCVRERDLRIEQKEKDTHVLDDRCV